MTVAKKVAAKAPARKKPASVAAREAEAGDGFVVIEHLGLSLRVPVYGEVTIAVVDMFRDGDTYGGTRELLGAEQWQALSAAGMTRNSLGELADKMREAWGN